MTARPPLLPLAAVLVLGLGLGVASAQEPAPAADCPAARLPPTPTRPQPPTLHLDRIPDEVRAAGWEAIDAWQATQFQAFRQQLAEWQRQHPAAPLQRPVELNPVDAPDGIYVTPPPPECPRAT
jgi:hypothetical protein